MNTIEIINQQKIKKVNLKKIHFLLEKVFISFSTPKKKYLFKISFLLCDNKLIKKLNKRYLGKGSVTDVIAFPLPDSSDPGYLGEVVVSVEQSVKVAKKLGISWQRELLLYMVHGILHLIGYDDRTKQKREVMEKKQSEILNKII